MSERVAAAFVFTDLVGSTALATGLAPSDADEVRRAHFAVLRAAVEDAGGREVKNLGDGLMVVFAGPSRALSCAVAMQQAIDRHNRTARTPLSVRVGVATGEVTEDDGDFFGDSVVEAARLCATAEGGQILATELVRLMVGRQVPHVLRSIGDLTLKGLPAPVATLEVMWEPVGASPNADRVLPARLASAAGGGLFGFAGRTAELDTIEAARKQAAAERTMQLVLVAGEPGVGKTTVAAKAAARAHAEGWTVVFGECTEESNAPYQPWLGALSQLIRAASDLAPLPPVYAGVLRRLLPADVDRLPPGEAVSLDPETERLMRNEAVAALLDAASGAAPVMVVIDDLHWADAATLSLLRHLLTTESLVVLVIATYRQSDLGAGHPLIPWLADLHREPATRRLSMDGLGDADIVTLMQTAAGHELDESAVTLAHGLRQETDGNPFFVAELLRHLSESGAIIQDADGRYVLAGDVAELSLPASVLDVVDRRAQRLGGEAVPALSAAAVIGREFDLDLVERIADVEGDALLDLIERATIASLVSETEIAGRYRFAHALVQHSLYRSLSATRRQRLHLRAAEALEALLPLYGEDPARLADVARHWQAATRPADAAKAVEYARRAGEAALAALSPDDAARWFEQAVDAFERDPRGDKRERFALLMRLLAAQEHSDHTRALNTTRTAGLLAEEIGDPQLLITWALARLSLWRASEPADHQILRLLHHALDAADPDDLPVRARLLGAILDETDPGDWRTRRDLAGAALAAAEASGDDATLVFTLLARAFVAWVDVAHDDPARIAWAVHKAETTFDPVHLGALLQLQSSVSLTIGDTATARAAKERLDRLEKDYPLPIVRFDAIEVAVVLAMLDGDLEALERAADAVLAISARGLPSVYASYGGALFELRMAQGRLPEFGALFGDALTDLASYAGFRPALVHTHLACGRPEDARTIFLMDASDGFESFPRDSIWLACLHLYAEAAIDLDDIAAARALYNLLSPWADLHAAGGPIYYGLTDRVIGRLAGRLGRPDEAEERLRHALEAHRSIGARYWTAVTAVDLAELLASTGRAGEARDLISAAQALTDTGGYNSLTPRLNVFKI